MSEADREHRLQQILESCYAAVCDGNEPDLDALCADAPELRGRVARLLERERTLLLACVGSEGAPATPLPNAPDRIGDFVVLEPIGVGGMSNVFRARQEPLGREVALKVLRDDVVASPTGRLRFTREATITASLEHPHIVPVYGAGEADGHVYLAMKLLRGHSLDRQRTAFSPQQVARIGCEMASALAAAHEVGVVHRDVKPANVVLEHGTAYVVDFGLAAFADRASLLTQPDTTPGTLIYLPPEVAGRKASNLDPRADVYGGGATLYELLAGRPPFDPSNPVRALRQILHEQPRPLELAGRDRDLETVVLRAMDKSPERRFQTAAELEAELQRYRDGLPILTRPPDPFARLARTIRRRPGISALVAIIVVLAGMLTLQAALQDVGRRRRQEHTTQAFAAALDAGDLASAQQRLDQLADIAGAAAATAGLQQRYRHAFDLQLFAVALSHPLADDLDGYLDELRERVLAGATARPPRLVATLALAGWQQRGGPVPPPPGLDAHVPRLCALLACPPESAALLTSLQQVRDAGDATDLDCLLSAAALRHAGVAEPLVEAELRRAGRGRQTGPLTHSLAMSLEAQGRHREAFETYLQLTAHPVCGPLARWSTARLAALLGEHAVARRQLEDADDGDDALLRELSVPSRLQILAQGPPDAFWTCWHAAPERVRQLAQYWRMAGYVQSDTAETLDDLDTAIAHFERGLTCAADDVQRAGLEIAIEQTRWIQLAAQLDAEPTDELPAALRERLLATAQRCEQLADRCERMQLPVTITTDALLTAANCRIERQEWAIARELFDRAARYDEPLPLAEYALQVARLVAFDLLGDEAVGIAPRDAFGDLGTAAHVALERARRVLARHDGGRTVGERERQSCEAARILCAAYVGDARTALPAAQRWSPNDDPLDRSLSVLVQRLQRSGGVLLDSPGIAPAALHAVVHGAAMAVDAARRAGHYDDADIAAIVARWRAHPRVAAVITTPSWQHVSAELDRLGAAAGR